MRVGAAAVVGFVVGFVVEEAGGRALRSTDTLRLWAVRVRVEVVAAVVVVVAPCDGGRSTVEGLRVVGVVVLLARVCVATRLVWVGG